MDKIISKKKIIYLSEVIFISILVIAAVSTGAGPSFTRKIIYLLPVIFAFDLFVLERDYVKEHQSEVFIVFLTVFLSSLPLFIRGLKYGDDLIFHLNRIEGIYAGLNGGIFPVKIQPNWFNGAGYATGVMYGDILLYIPAVLRMAGFEVYASYKIFLFIINVCTVLIAVFSFSRIFRKKETGLLCAFVYSLAPYRMINLYRRAAVGESIAMTVLPLIMLAVYMIYTTECRDKKENKKIVLMLTIGMSVLVQSHILSTEMTVICLAVVCIVLWKKTFRKNVIIVYLISAACTAALSLYFLVPFMDYMTGQDMWLKEQIRIGVFRNIENHALPVGNLFTFFYTGFTDNDVCRGFNPGIVLMAVFVIGIYLYINGKLTKKAKIYFWFSLGLMILSTNLFSWRLWGKTPIGYMMTSVQSPWRYITYAVCFLTLLLGELHGTYESDIKERKMISVTAVLLVIISVSVFSSAYDEYDHDASYKEGSELDTYFAGGREYVPTAALEDIPELFEISGGEITGYSRNLYRFDIQAVTSEAGYIELPLIGYKGYVATDSATGENLDITTAPNSALRILLPAGYNGSVSVDFHEPPYWRAAEIISLISLLVFVTFFGYNRRRYQ